MSEQYTVTINAVPIPGSDYYHFWYSDSVDPETSRNLKLYPGDQVIWLRGSNITTFHLAFDQWPFTQDTGIISYAVSHFWDVRGSCHRKVFKYTVYAQLFDGRWVKDDPDIEVQDVRHLQESMLIGALGGAAIGAAAYFALRGSRQPKALPPGEVE